MRFEIAKEAEEALNKLQSNGYEAYLVGGCIRDMLINRKPSDWDIATNASEKEIKEIFGITNDKTGYAIVVKKGKEKVEVGTYKKTDNDEIATIYTDLGCRDFTINSLAYNHKEEIIIDMFNGMQDLSDKRLRCVGNPDDKFKEDGIRVLRLFRFMSVLGFKSDKKMIEIAKKNTSLVGNQSKRRVRLELCKLLMGNNVGDVLRKYPEAVTSIIPDLKGCVGYNQNNKYHHLDLYEHTVRALEVSVRDIDVRLVLLLHDIGKPDVMKVGDDGYNHYHGHGIESKKRAKVILKKLGFNKKHIGILLKLIEMHDDQMGCTEKSIKRVISRIGEESTKKLLYIRQADIEAHNPEYNESKITLNKERIVVFNKLIKEGKI